ncbi:calcium/sodium antiporter [Microvirga guangxiensis]|uniref:Cation:H+ antiporter n=1 Tax=Microvirga guangxiensis TaxID=549386 RepID=A0A1G5KDE9_9HYPH|nr:calcium/sodium antiporter [Microvirga guangxiensis]SCY98060.1 cation:H+ antiporter [Microvirga guangxiensis]
MDIIFFLGGLVLLVVGAEILVKGASRLALSLGLSPLVVGLTVVAFGTSAPEVAVSVGAVLGGQTDIAIGNVVGSNIFNVLFILGVSALVTPLIVNRQVIRQEVPIMIGVSTLLLVMLRDRVISTAEAALLLALLVGYTAFLVVQSWRANRRVPDEGLEGTVVDGSSGSGSRLAQAAMILVGLACLVAGSRLLVAAAVSFAIALGVSDLIVGLTIVAAGTSLPEVATSITAAVRGNRDIAVGNVVGSNVFNILGCLGLSGLAAGGAGITVAPSILAFDAWVMLATAVACLPILLTGREIARWEGVVFLAYYVFYVGYLILAAEQHDALETYTRAMTTFVVPLTLLTAGVIYAGSRKLRRG